MIVNNTTASDVALDDFGLTIPASYMLDISHIRRSIIKGSEVFRGLIEDGTLQLVREDNPNYDTYWSIKDALDIIDTGVNGFQVGINKPTRPGIIEGNYYGPSTDTALIDDSVPADHLNAIPVNYMGVYFNRIGLCVTTPAANGVVRLGVYENNNGLPGKLLLDAGTVPLDTIGNKEIIIDFTTPNDWCFLATHSNFGFEAKSVDSLVSVFGNNSNNITEATRHIHTDLIYDGSPLPSVFPASEPSASYPPFVWLRKV